MRADTVLFNADIHTMDSGTPRAAAAALSGGNILAVGMDSDMLQLLSRDGIQVDCGGRTVIPGFIDCHLHFASYAASLQQIDLSGVASLEECLERVGARAKKTASGEWIQGRGWNQSLWEGGKFPDRKHLDRAAPENPVLLKHNCGHASWVNSRALDIAGITRDTPDPEGGEIEKDPETGEPTGILKERAAHIAVSCLPEPSAEEIAETIHNAIPTAHQAGLTGIHNMEGDTVLRAFQHLLAERSLKLRVLMQIAALDLDAAVQAGIQTGFGNEMLRIGGVKMFADGALGSRTAYMLEPHEGEPGNCGIAVSPFDSMRERFEKANRSSLPVYVHAIGDRANREVLDIFEELHDKGIAGTLRNRIEHVQLLHPDDIPRLKKLGVIASMQPIHCTQDMDMADRHWGARSSGAYAFRNLLDLGTVLAFGSDAPVEDIQPLIGIHAAVTRRRANGSPGPEGWHSEQRIRVEEAVRAYTSDAAYAGGEEDIKGTISPGKLADLVILSENIFEIDPMDIIHTEVIATMINGEFVYSSGEIA